MRSAAKVIAAGYIAVFCGLAAALWPANEPDRQEQASAGNLGLSPYNSISTDLPSDIVRPDLEPWGLVFVGGRSIAVEGRKAFQFFYTTENKDLGKVSLFVTSTKETDVDPTYDNRDGVNMLYWRHRGHGYYIVGSANKGWMWSLKNDIAYQLRAM